MKRKVPCTDISKDVNVLYIVVALVKLTVFHSCTIVVFFRYVQIKNLLFIIIYMIILSYN